MSASASRNRSTSNKSRSRSLSFSKVKSNCSPKKLLAFSKKHYTYINQIFGDATVREIIEEEYFTTWEFHVAKAGPEFGNSFHHTVRDREDPDIFVCSVMDDIQDLHKNVNDTLCQSYSLMNFFEIPIQSSGKKGEQTEISQERNQMSMIKMYRDILNGTLEEFKGINFKEILTNQILSDKRNKKLWRNFVAGKGHISMTPKVLFKNIEDTLTQWEEFGYWFFIGKGECPTHGTYSAEMNYLKDRSQELSDERHEEHDMGLQDDNSRFDSKTRKNRSSSKSKSSNKSASKGGTKRFKT